ncbi:MAG: hypothetical protein IT548_06295 [Alphaproteobacteria bacterium]|nr:hypothetical protein [Alphaproteobacteria bacterium]
MMKASASAHMFEDTLGRIRRALDDLRLAIANGTATDAKAAAELAERMEHYIATAGEPDPGEMLPGLLSRG